MKLKFRTKEEGILKINDLLLKGYSVPELRNELGIYKEVTSSGTRYFYNNKIGTLHDKHWNWKEKLVLSMLK